MITGAEKFKTLFEKYKEEKRPVLLYGDPDVDGLYSLFLMAKFVEMMGITNYAHFVNEKRRHDWEIPAEKLNGYLVISADFTIPKTVLTELTDNNVVVLASDHHELDKPEEFIEVTSDKTGAEAIFISNQYSFEPEDKRFLSGAGVFYELICSIYPQFESHLYKALVGITLLSDMRRTDNDNAKDYLKSTYTMPTSDPYVKYLLNSFPEGKWGSFGEPKLSRVFIEFKLCPMINALLRFDKLYEAEEFILGRGLQDKSRHQAQKDIISYILSQGTESDYGRVVFLQIQDNEFRVRFPYADPANFIGIICNALREKKKQSVLGMVMKDGKIVRASFRGIYSTVPYRDAFNRNVDNAKAVGHSAAFGLIDLDKIIEDDKSFTMFMDSVENVVENLEDTYESKGSDYKVIDMPRMFMGTNQELLRTIATENIYLNPEYRTYIRYTGGNVIESKVTYKTRPLSKEDIETGEKPDDIKNNTVYLRDTNGNKIPKYIEYLVEGRVVKSYGTPITEGLIEPFIGDAGLEFNVVNIK